MFKYSFIYLQENNMVYISQYTYLKKCGIFLCMFVFRFYLFTFNVSPWHGFLLFIHYVFFKNVYLVQYLLHMQVRKLLLDWWRLFFLIRQLSYYDWSTKEYWIIECLNGWNNWKETETRKCSSWWAWHCSQSGNNTLI